MAEGAEQGAEEAVVNAMRTLAAAALIAAASPVAAQVAMAPLSPGETLLEVSAQGRTYATPDRATIRGGVTTMDADARAATEANARTMAAVIDALKRAGVDAADVRTDRVSLSPVINRNPGDQSAARITGYRAANSVTVTLRALDKASDVVTSLFAAGANDVSGPFFTVENDAPARDAARKDAVQRARAEAESYAAAFGMRVARVLRISERAAAMGYAGNIVASGSRIPAPAPPAPPGVPVAIGQMEILANLWVDFALTPAR